MYLDIIYVLCLFILFLLELWPPQMDKNTHLRWNFGNVGSGQNAKLCPSRKKGKRAKISQVVSQVTLSRTGTCHERVLADM